MDGNKKVKGIVLVGFIVFAITACKVQQPGYVGLYVDNSISVNDTIDPGVAPLRMVDTTMTRIVDTTAGIEAGLPDSLRLPEELLSITSDSVYQYEVNGSLEAISDSIQLMRHNNSAGLKADTVYIAQEIVKLIKGDSIQADYETTQLLQARNDTIAYLRKQLHDLQYSGSIITDTVYIFKETAILPGAESRQTDLMTMQLIKAKDEQIQLLQYQLNAMQTASATTPQQNQITREPVQELLTGNKQTDNLTLQLLQAKNDTILFLRNQLYKMRLPSPAKDTVTVGNERKDMQPAKEVMSEQETSALFKALQDTMLLLKTMVLSLEEQITPGMDTTTLSNQDKKDIPSPATDTILLVAYYELGEIKPLEEKSILNQIKELCRNNKVTKIALSGYTDSSGNELINKEITDTRLNYLLEGIIPWVAKERVFFQNFGDAFASEKVVTEERKIEIRIHTE